MGHFLSPCSFKVFGAKINLLGQISYLQVLVYPVKDIKSESFLKFFRNSPLAVPTGKIVLFNLL